MIQTAKLSITSYINIKHYLKESAEELDVHIALKSVDTKGKSRITHFGNKKKETIKIGLLDEHYFRIEKVNITSYAINNYEKIKDKDNWNYYVSTKKKDKSKKIDSFKMITLLLENKNLLKKITVSNGLDSTVFHDKNSEIESLEYNNNNFRHTEKKKLKIKKIPKVWFDFETTTDGKKHKQYLVCWINEQDKVYSARLGGSTPYNSQPAYKMLQSITEETMLIAHNLAYDFRFLYPYLFNMRITMKGNKIVMGTAMFKNDNLGKNIKVHFKDSYFLISMPLRKFASAFMLDSKKEVMPYNLYSEKNINQTYQKISDGLKHLRKDEHEQFIKNIKEWNLQSGDQFDFITYSEKYCKLDCIVLKKGYEIFRKQMIEITDLDIDYIATLPSLADKFLIKEGCYDGVYEFSGVVRAFIQKCVIGGRVMCRENTKRVIKKILQDFDAVSLYPSAMVRMPGFLKGIPKIIKDFDYIKKNASGYFVEIEVTKIGKHRAFPLISTFDENGIRNFSNEIPKRSIFVDNTTLEDMIKYQDVEYKFIRGYYFDQGFNPQIKKTMRTLFNERIKKKKLKGSNIQLLYKLIMNAAYGKTILKPIKSEKKFYNTKKKAEKFFLRNYNQVKYMTQLGDSNKHLIKLIKPINSHFNRCHVGVQILSMSKRIMNEVMCLAEDISAKIYYQDTDSMHIEDDKIELLSNAFREKYGRELVGKDLGQFHCDFDYEHDKGTLPVSVESVFLGKKSYIDKVEVVKDGKKEYHYHIRMKGIPGKCITDLGDPMETYLRLYEGEAIRVNLVSGGKLMFDFKPNFDITTRSEFFRVIQF